MTSLTESNNSAASAQKQLEVKVREAEAKACSAETSANNFQNSEAELAQKLTALAAVERALRSEHEESLARLQASQRTASANEKARASLEDELLGAKDNVKRMRAKFDASEAEHAAAAQLAKVHPHSSVLTFGFGLVWACLVWV